MIEERNGETAPLPEVAAPSLFDLNDALRERLRAIGLPVGTAVAVLGSWELGVKVLHVAPIILPPPSSIASTIVRIFPILLTNAAQTAWEAAVGLLLAALLGIGVGVLMTYSKTFRQAVYPNMVFFQLIPKVALGPLFIMWLGIGSQSRLTFAVFIAFFPIALSTATGLVAVDRSYIRFCKSLTATDWQIFMNVRFPFALPSIFNGLKIGVTMSFIGVIVGEFITSQSGLGYLILFASARGETAVVFASITILCLIGLAYYGAVTALEVILLRLWGPAYV